MCFTNEEKEVWGFKISSSARFALTLASHFHFFLSLCCSLFAVSVAHPLLIHSSQVVGGALGGAAAALLHGLALTRMSKLRAFDRSQGEGRAGSQPGRGGSQGAQGSAHGQVCDRHQIVIFLFQSSYFNLLISIIFFQVFLSRGARRVMT